MGESYREGRDIRDGERERNDRDRRELYRNEDMYDRRDSRKYVPGKYRNVYQLINVSLKLQVHRSNQCTVVIIHNK